MKQNRTGPPEASIILQNKSFNNNKIITKAVFQRSSGRERRKEKRKSVASNFSLLLPFFVCRRCRRNTRHAWHILSDWMSFRGQITFSKAIKRRCVTKLLCVYVYMFACVCVWRLSFIANLSLSELDFFLRARVFSLLTGISENLSPLFSHTDLPCVSLFQKRGTCTFIFIRILYIPHPHIYTYLSHLFSSLARSSLSLFYMKCFTIKSVHPYRIVSNIKVVSIILLCALNE